MDSVALASAGMAMQNARTGQEIGLAVVKQNMKQEQAVLALVTQATDNAAANSGRKLDISV